MYIAVASYCDQNDIGTKAMLQVENQLHTAIAICIWQGCWWRHSTKNGGGVTCLNDNLLLYRTQSQLMVRYISDHSPMKEKLV